MKEYFIHKASGEITASGFCQDEYFDTQTRGDPDLSVVEGKAEYGRDYWDGSAVVPIPARPSDNHVFDYATKTWQDPRTLDDLKAAKWAEVKSWRSAATVAPLMPTRFGTFDAATKDMENIKDTLAGLNSAESLGMTVSPIRWTMADANAERYVWLTLNELREVGVLLLARGNLAHEHSRVLFDQIEAATTPEDLDTILWGDGT